MKYETPELVPLTPAVNAIQGTPANKANPGQEIGDHEVTSAYEDWE